MDRTRYPETNFEKVTATDRVYFTCSKCGKEKRMRTIHTVQAITPWNIDPKTGIPLTPSQVRLQAEALLKGTVARFLIEPLCEPCEKKTPRSELISLRARREIEFAKRPKGA